MTSITLRRSATDLAVKLKFASGLPGVPGEASDLQEGSVTTLDASADADFSITGTPPNQILNLSLPRGLTGPVGEGSGGLFFETRTAAASAMMGADIKSIRTAGFAVASDKGRGNYSRRQTTPYELWTSKNYVPTHSTVQNASGNFYRLITRPAGSVTSTIQPTHTSFTEVVGADGFGWLRINSDPQYFRSVDRYRYDGISDALHGGWWELELANGSEVLVEQLGGKGDHVLGSTTTTDNWDAIMAAHNWVQFDPAANTASDHGPTLVFGIGMYRVSKTVIFTNIMRIKGAGIGFDAFGFGQATQIHFTNTTGSAFVIMPNNVGPTEDSGSWGAGQNTGTAGGTVLDGFSIHGTWDQVTKAASNDYTAAVRARAIVQCNRIGVHGWRSNGFHIHASNSSGSTYPMEGNANCWRLVDCYVHSCGARGLWVAGIDVNGGYSINFITHTLVMGTGLEDDSSLGNTHVQPQITGYGNKGVCYDHGGSIGFRQYQFIGGNPNTTTPGTNNHVWYYLRDGGTSSSFPVWSSGGDYSMYTIPIYVFSTLTTIVSPYIEGVNVIGHSNGPVIGSGAGVWTRYTAARDRAASVAWFLSPGTTPETVANGQGVTRIDYGIEHPAGGLASGPQFISWNRAIHGDGVSGSFGWIGRDVFWQAAGQSLGNTNKFVFRITEKDTDIDYGTGVGVDTTSRMVLMDPALSNLEGFSANPTTRIFGLREAAPSDPMVYSQGSRYQNAGTGGAGTTAQWVCSQSGVINGALWSSGVTTGGGVIFKVASSGKYYRSLLFGVSTTEPTHTSGTVTLDGIPWTYLGNSAPVFVLDAVVVKQTNAYTTSNVSADRTYDANATTLDEVADVLGTLIADLKLAGVIT